MNSKPKLQTGEFYVWRPDEDPDGEYGEHNLGGRGVDAQEAAEDWVQRMHGDWEYPDEVEVAALDGEGRITRWRVTCEEYTKVLTTARPSENDPPPEMDNNDPDRCGASLDDDFDCRLAR